MVGLNLRFYQIQETYCDRQLAQTRLDRHLPKTSDTQQSLVALVLNQIAGVIVQLLASVNEPHEGMGIEQELHRM